MTGWRLGWMLAPARLLRAVDVLTGNFSICPPVLAQRAALAAFDAASYAELDGHVRRYAQNRELLLDGLQRLGIDRLAPADGAFYAYADVGHLTDDSMTFARELLARTGVAVASGIDFDTVDGGRYLRFSFAGTAADIEEALDRLDGAPRVPLADAVRAPVLHELRHPPDPHHHRRRRRDQPVDVRRQARRRRPGHRRELALAEAAHRHQLPDLPRDQLALTALEPRPVDLHRLVDRVDGRRPVGGERPAP